MRNETEIKERVLALLVEEMNRPEFKNLTIEPENVVPKFLESVSSKVTELCLDEIAYRRKY